MFRKPFASMVFYLKHRSPSMLFASCIVLVSTFVLLANSTNVLADGVPGGNITNPVVRAVDVAKPAVVRIITNISGNVTVDFSATRSATFPLNGSNYKLEFSGSGAFITAHGDILTADHVINPPHGTDLDKALYQMASQDVASYVNLNFAPGTPYTAIDALSLLANGNFHATTHYGQPGSDVYLSTDYTGPLAQTNFKKLGTDVHLHVSKIEQQSATNIHDVALIHVNLDDTPSIQLGDSSNVEQQDELTIIGFPGNADISNNQDPTQLLTSSVNKIYVSALKINNAGSPLIQVGGNVEHGDSGGPALDSNGNVVGIVSFYSSAADYPVATSFLQASSNAQTLIQDQKLDTAPGSFEKAWKQAFADYASTAPGHWHKAKQELQKLANKYTNFNEVTPYLNYAQGQASHEILPSQTKTASTDYTSGAIAIVGTILMLLIVVSCLLFVASKRKKSFSAHLAVPGISTSPSTQVARSNPPSQPFPEWKSQQVLPPELQQADLQQHGASSPAWSLPITPTPIPWQQEPYSVPVSPTPPIFEKWQQPSAHGPSSPVSPTQDVQQKQFSMPPYFPPTFKKDEK